ncbi:bifunctional DNA-formamidopyrimidine glycosylase/DNA-(apurinic or apyrimidinic site) lyase [Chloroflexota bacterium]
MPELPEVETIRNELMPHIIGRQVTGVTLNWEGMVRNGSATDFCSRLTGQKITGIGRRGKYLLFNLSGGEILVIHLRMTGALLINSALPDERFIRAVIHLDEGQDIYFRDPRKFGVMWLSADETAITGKLGPEPLEDGFTTEVLTRLLCDRVAPIKALLLEQALVAGIGNMYADEAIFAAGIHPLRRGGSLSRDEVARLFVVIQQVLRAAIDHQGASVRNYYRPGGELGTAHFQFNVAHCGGKPCNKCGTPIQRVVVRNRGTYFCPRCQPEA